MRAFHVSSEVNNTIYAPLNVTTAKQTTEERALLDCGATHNFMDTRTMIRLGIGTKKMDQPQQLTNVDGTNNRAGAVNRFALMTFLYQGEERQLPIYVTNLGQDRIIFGIEWFKAFNPEIDWKNGSLSGTVAMTTKRAQINATTSVEWSIQAEKDKKRLTENDLPEQYHAYKKVFSEEAAKRFPPAREEDHEITFTNEVPKSFKARTYHMDKEQTSFLREWIDEELKKGFIRESKSAYPSPTFLIKKANGDYRVVQDYRDLNKYTVPDKTPLPLIPDLIDRLHGKTLFTKFDIRMGYNNIRIKEGDQQKAAFTTPLGQFEPMVMSFGLRNAPGTFQRTMNRLFREIQNKYPDEVQIYMDDILIATTNDIDRHRRIVKEILAVMEDASLFLKIAKCEFEVTRTQYLGLILDDQGIRPDPTKTAGLKEWPTTLKTVKEVRSTLGLLNYHRAFVPGFSHIAKPLTRLLKKNTPFHWTPECSSALKTLIQRITDDALLVHPDSNKTFELEVDASNVATGAILFQRDDRGKPQPIGFHSKTLSKEEQNYDIYDKELTALDRGLETWRHLLLGRHTIIHTDHANLTYYRKPQRLTPRAKRAIARIMQYDVLIKHKPGILNKADALSRRPDYHASDNEPEIAFPDSMFANTSSLLDTLPSITDAQNLHSENLRALTAKFPIAQRSGLWWHGSCLVVPEDNTLRKGVIALNHDSSTTGHPGQQRTIALTKQNYWWPSMNKDIRQYVQGCAVCQSTKPRTNHAKPPLYPIPAEHYTIPFATVAIDFITKLPNSQGNDTILTITDHDCSKAALFLPCKETITAEELAALWLKNVFPHYGVPMKIISDRDPRFTGAFFTELCKKLRIKQNLSSAFHPQTDGQSERTNQWLEQYLRIYCNYQQNDWAEWLSIAQYTHNSWVNESTKKVPFTLLIGGLPSGHAIVTKRTVIKDDRTKRIQQTRIDAKEAMTKTIDVSNRRSSNYQPYEEGDQVWLEATNLKVNRPSTKLAPRRYGPFKVIKKVSNVVFKLQLPPKWKIHDVFHASLLSPYIETTLHGPNYPEPPPEVIDGQPEYEVESIVGSRRFGRYKTLQYKIHWKGYSDAHDSWEPVSLIKAPKLIEEFEKRHNQGSSQHPSNTNYQADLGTLTKQTLPRHQNYSSQKRGPSSSTECETAKECNSGSHFQVSYARLTELRKPKFGAVNKHKNPDTTAPKNNPMSSNNEQTSIPFVPNSELNNPSPFAYFSNPNSPDMTTPIRSPPRSPGGRLVVPPEIDLLTEEGLRQMETRAEEAISDSTPNSLPTIYHRTTQEILADPESVRVQRLADEITGRATRSIPYDISDPRPLLVVTNPGQALLREVLRADLRSRETTNNSPSPTPTASLHPGYPFREHTEADTDLLDRPYPRPYLAVSVSATTGEPYLRGVIDAEGAYYHEGTLEAKPVNDVDPDIENEVTGYPFGENAYLDPAFLSAIGNIADRGILAETLRLVQNDCRERELARWSKQLISREAAVSRERVEYQAAKLDCEKQKDKVQQRLRRAKAYSRLSPLMPDRPGAPGMSFPSAARPYPTPDSGPHRTENNHCFWCGGRGLNMHKSKDCGTPHQRCRSLRPGRCIVTKYHKYYHTDLAKDPCPCPYYGDNRGEAARDHHM